MIYLDTSVLTALYIQEPKSEIVQEFVRGIGKPALSSLTEVEFTSAVSRRTRMRELSQDDGFRVISQFQLHVNDHMFTLYPIMQKEFELAREWIGRLSTPLRTLDALHLAVAFANHLTLATADRHLAESAIRLGVAVEGI
jgi:uncharacterized protein